MINRNDVIFYQAKRKKLHWIFIICQNFSNKYKKQLLDTGLDALKSTSKQVVHKAAERIVAFIPKNTAGKTVKSKHATEKNSRNVEEKIIAPEKKEKKNEKN